MQHPIHHPPLEHNSVHHDAKRAADHILNGNLDTARQIIHWSADPVSCALLTLTFGARPLPDEIDKMLTLFHYDGPRGWLQ